MAAVQGDEGPSGDRGACQGSTQAAGAQERHHRVREQAARRRPHRVRRRRHSRQSRLAQPIAAHVALQRRDTHGRAHRRRLLVGGQLQLHAGALGRSAVSTPPTATAAALHATRASGYQSCTHRWTAAAVLEAKATAIQADESARTDGISRPV